MTAAVELDGITRRFKIRGRKEPLTVLDDISMTVPGGGSIAIVGLSGAGKSTLLNVLGLLDRPDEGTISLFGQETTTLPERQRASLRGRTIGFVFQQLNLLSGRSARQQVAVPLMYEGGRALRRRHELADEALRRVGLAERLHSQVSELSGGEQQRVAIARALIRDPRLILADEPTGALDPVTAAQVMDLLFATAREDGRALILVTHDHNLARRADRLYTLDAGRLYAGEPQTEAEAEIIAVDQRLYTDVRWEPRPGAGTRHDPRVGGGRRPGGEIEDRTVRRRGVISVLLRTGTE